MIMHFIQIAGRYAGIGRAIGQKIGKDIPFVKVLTVFLLLVLLQISFSASAQTVTLSERNSPINEVFKALKKQTGYDFIYDDFILGKAKPVSIQVKDEKLDQVLQKIFSDQPLSYKIFNQTISVKLKNEEEDKNVRPTDGAFTITGKVVSSMANTPLSQATVMVKGRKTVAVTNNQGEFTLPVFMGSELVISYVGFETTEQKIKNQQPLQIVLVQKDRSLNEVVVGVNTGYQTIDPRRLTSAITTVKAKDILVPGITTIDKALEGRVPGLFVLNNSGQVGAAPKIRIRGTSTVLGSREPVWVLDGVVINSPVNIDPARINDLDFVNLLGNAVSGLNPQDIEQIDVLKDASATALYGVRAANGVIVITTKKGHAGPPTVSFSTSASYTRRPRYTDKSIYLMNSRERVDYSREIINKGITYPANINWVGYEGALRNLYNNNISYSEFQQQVNKLEQQNTDWFSLIAHDTWSSTNNVNISGGTSKLRYFASLGASNENGVIRGDKVNRYTANINLNGNITDRLMMNVSFLGNTGVRNYAASSVDALGYAYRTNREIPGYNEDGSLNYYDKLSSYGGYTSYYKFNILNEMANSRDITNNSGMMLTTNFNYKVSEALKAMVLFSYTLNNTNQEISFLENTFYAAERRASNLGEKPDPGISLMPYGGELQENNVRNTSYTVRGQLDYNKDLAGNDKHFLNVAIGSEVSSNKYNGFTSTQRGYLPERGKIFAPVDPLKYPAYANWETSENLPKVMDQMTNLLSAYFTTSYTYDNRYTINFNTRTDASNKFGTRSNEKLLPTWSVSGRWNTAQDLFPNSKQINLMAIRASYGYQGNMLDNQTPNLIIKQGATDPVTEEYFSTIYSYPNPNLRWEKTGAVNVAMDFSLFNNRLSGTLGYFYKKTTNAFLDKNITDINGRISYVVNTGNIENKGFEVALSFIPINTSGNRNGFKWRIDPQIGAVVNNLIAKAINHNQVESGSNGNPNTYNSYLSGSALFDGKAINTFYSYQFDGLSPVNGSPVFKQDDREKDGEKYAHMTNDDVFQSVMKSSGNRIPTIQGGFSNFLSYKGFTLNFNFTYSVGAKVRLMPLYTKNSTYGKTNVPLPEENASRVFVDRWKQSGDETKTTIPAILSANDYYATQQHWSAWFPYNYAANIWSMYDNSDVRVVSGNYLKLSTLALSYQLPEKLAHRCSMSNVYLTLAGTDLYTLCSKDLRGQDPSQSGFSETAQLSNRPRVSFNLNVSF